MLRLFATIKKELLVLMRDRGGLAILFLMPLLMITIMALIQDAPFRDYQELKIPLLIVNQDDGILGQTMEKGLTQSRIFEISEKKMSREDLKTIIGAGDYEIGIWIPKGASDSFNANVKKFVDMKMGNDTLMKGKAYQAANELNVQLYFAPSTKKSFKVSILSSLKQFSSKLSTLSMMNRFVEELGMSDENTVNDEAVMDKFVQFTEEEIRENGREDFALNSVQHNVPAWTIFGMFFIVLSMAGSMIKEREDGSYLRLRTMPGNYATVIAGKVSAYLLVCLLQCFLMLMVGIYLMPLLGLPKLIIGNNIPAITLIAVSCGLAATGSGIIVGTAFNTHQQATTFGAVSIVILAALGGIWVPVYVMPDSIRFFSEFSPLYWGLKAFHEIFISYGTVSSIFPYALKLLLFFIVTVTASYFIMKKKTY